MQIPSISALLVKSIHLAEKQKAITDILGMDVHGIQLEFSNLGIDGNAGATYMRQANDMIRNRLSNLQYFLDTAWNALVERTAAELWQDPRVTEEFDRYHKEPEVPDERFLKYGEACFRLEIARLAKAEEFDNDDWREIEENAQAELNRVGLEFRRVLGVGQAFVTNALFAERARATAYRPYTPLSTKGTAAEVGFAHTL